MTTRETYRERIRKRVLNYEKKRLEEETPRVLRVCPTCSDDASDDGCRRCGVDHDDG